MKEKKIYNYERIAIKIRKEYEEKLIKLKSIYPISINWKLIEHIIDLELQRFWIK
jgi:hypothetical protein